MSLEAEFEKMRADELRREIGMLKSGILNVLLDLQVMIQDGEYDEALEHIKEHVEP